MFLTARQTKILNDLNKYIPALNGGGANGSELIQLGDLLEAAASIITADIADAAITAAKIASDAVTTVKILNANVTLAKLASGIAPSHIVKFAQSYTTLGGAAAEAVTIAGVAAGDIVSATLRQKGATPRTILTAIPTTNTVTLTFSGDPSTDHIVDIVVHRASA